MPQWHRDLKSRFESAASPDALSAALATAFDCMMGMRTVAAHEYGPYRTRLKLLCLDNPVWRAAMIDVYCDNLGRRPMGGNHDVCEEVSFIAELINTRNDAARLWALSQKQLPEIQDARLQKALVKLVREKTAAWPGIAAPRAA